MTEKEKEEKAEKLVDEFKDLFMENFGVYPAVCYDLNNKNIPKLSLVEIEKIVNQCFSRNFGDLYPNINIRNKRRKLPIITFRFIFFKIAKDMTYTYVSIARFLKFNHATVIHGYNTMTGLLESHDKQAHYYYNFVKNEIKSRISNNANVQPVEHEADNS
jgi:hypothetical protein